MDEEVREILEREFNIQDIPLTVPQTEEVVRDAIIDHFPISIDAAVTVPDVIAGDWQEAEVIADTEAPVEEIEDNEAPITMARFKGASWFDIVRQQVIILAGLGGIGSYVSFLLSRLSPFSVSLFDDDKFEAHNLSGQLASVQDIGTFKTATARKMAANFSACSTFSEIPEKYTESSFAAPIMICGFDNMKARSIFFNNWLKYRETANPEDCLFIDGRLLAEEYQVITLHGLDDYAINKYKEELLFEDSEVGEVDCTLKQTSHIAMAIAAKMVEHFVNFCNNLSLDNMPRRIPWFYSYNAVLGTEDKQY